MKKRTRNNRIFLTRLTLAASCLAVAACAPGPDYTPPKTDAQEKWASQAFAPVALDPVQVQWWTVFEDPMLTGYIVKATQHNKDIKIALANLRQARALRREEAGAFWPQAGAGGGAERSKSSEAVSGTGKANNFYDAGFDASWQLDIFGGTRRSVEAAEARAEGALADYQAVILSTLSEVARNYAEARGLQKRIAITEKNAALLKRSYDLVNDRLQVGEASEFDVTRARGEYQLIQARIPNLRAELQASVHALSVLLGQPPEALLSEMEEVKPLPVPPDMVPVGLRSEILRRRPDVRVAERNLAAAVADIGVETAELFPKFFLTGDVGSQARLFGDLFSASGGVWSLGSLFTWSLFEGGALRARIEAAKAGSDEALALYEKTVLEALQDAETALVRYGQELETRRRLGEGVESRRRSVTLARELFDAGEEDYLAVLDAERELTASEDNLVVSETLAVTKLIALYTALGGGWEVFEQAGNPSAVP